MLVFTFIMFLIFVFSFPAYNFYMLQKSTNSLNLYKSKFSGVVFQELKRYETESVMLRTDLNMKLLVPHKELEKNFTRM